MNRLRYDVLVRTQAGPSFDSGINSRYISVTVYLKAAQYVDGAPEIKLDAGSWAEMTEIAPSGEYKVYNSDFTNLSVALHNIYYRDNRGEKHLLEANILAYDSECGDENGGGLAYTRASLTETLGLNLSSKFAGVDEYDPYEFSIDEGGSWEAGIGPQSTLLIDASELDAVGEDYIPIWRRPTATSPLTCLLDSIVQFYIGPEQPGFDVTLVETPCSVFGGSDGEIATILEPGTYTFLWNDGATTQNRTGLTAGIYSVTITRDSDSVVQVETIEVTQPDQLAGDYEKQDVSVAGGSDGEIQVTVTGGSGNYTVLWFDDPTTSLNRSGLSAGTYSVQITDNETGEIISFVIEILDAVVEPVTGTIFEFGMLNSLRFVVDPLDSHDAENLQTPDNTLFCKQYHPGLKHSNYFDKFCFVDAPKVQFNSNFTAHTVQLLKYGTSTIVRSFASEIKQQNIGVTEQYAVTLRAHSVAGKTRVYFNVGAPPIPVAVGDSIEIIDNAESMNGTYLVAEVLVDPSFGYAYLVINTDYIGAASTSPANGVFSVDAADYNVYEAVATLAALDPGYYFMKVIAQDDFGNTRTGISEPIDLRANHRKSILIKCTNNDDDYGNITWSTGFEYMTRVDALMFMPMPGGERSVVRDADYSLVKVNARKSRSMEVAFYFLPPHKIEQLSWVLDADNFTINNVPYQTTEGLAEPDQPGKSQLIHSTAKVEQQNFNRSYNSDDIGSVNDGGFVAIEGGLLKL